MPWVLAFVDSASAAMAGHEQVIPQYMPPLGAPVSLHDMIQPPFNVLGKSLKTKTASEGTASPPAIGGGGSLPSAPPGLFGDDGNPLSFPLGIGGDGSAPSLPAIGGDGSVPSPPASGGDGSVPSPPAIGGDGNRALSTMEEFALLSDFPSWSAFGTVVKQKLKVRARHALSYHTTTACQPKNNPAPGGSLKDCGIPHTDPQTAIGVRGYEISATLPNSFEVGDGLQLQYHNEQHESHEKAVQQACVDLLCFLLVSGPEKVLMHSSCFRKGQEDISEIRRLAEQVKEDYLRRCHSESIQPLADRVQHPRPRENPAPRVRPPPGPSSNDEFSLQDKLEIFDHLTPMMEYTPSDKQLTGVRRIPPRVRAELQAKLKKGTLLSLLEAHPNLFRVTYTGEKNAKGKPQFTFAVLLAQPSMHAN